MHLALFALVDEGVRPGVAAIAVPHDDVGVGLDDLPRVRAGSGSGHCWDGWVRRWFVVKDGRIRGRGWRGVEMEQQHWQCQLLAGASPYM